jgi:histone demethylase JARID1
MVAADGGAVAPEPAAGRRAKRTIRAPTKFDDDAGFNDADLQRALKASMKHVRRVSSTTVPECPVFTPTAEQFADPFAYIKSITPDAMPYGIAKIIPPEGTRARHFTRRPARSSPRASCVFLVFFAPRPTASAHHPVPPPTRAGWKPPFNEEAGGDGIPFDTKLQTVNRLQEGLHFEDGERYTRDSYRHMADAFKEKYMETHARVADETARLANENPGWSEHTCGARALEEEFWRIVETDVESIRVEYGSDLDADVYGSGFASVPVGSVSAAAGASPDSDSDEDGGVPHAWDFGELIAHPSNLLRVVGGDIPGLTRPWLYFGMMFSAFCWHVEDHYLGSINYMHAGAAKTWYGVPTHAADAFERAVRAIVPGIFKDAPDLLHRLVTLVPPAVLAGGHGVPVCQTVQRAGEFVVTWPRAYHAGFSHGWNVGEAVNFGTADWVPMGRAALNDYQHGVGKRDSIFSHEKMILDTAKAFVRRYGYGDTESNSQEDQALRAPWIARMAESLRAELEIIVKEQRAGRTAVKGRGVREAAGSVKPQHEEEDENCALCKAMPHLAVVHCARCFEIAETIEIEQAVARARAEGRSASGAAWAFQGGGSTSAAARLRQMGRYHRRRRRNRPVFCLKHALDGNCGHGVGGLVMTANASMDELERTLAALKK